MKKLLLVLAEFFLIIGLWLGVYYIYRQRGSGRAAYQSLMTRRMDLANAELEEELMYFLAKELGIYTGEFEIVDVVNLATHEIAGLDYILVTIKTPDDRLCQVTISRSTFPWSQWELNPGSFNVVEIVQPGLESQTTKWMQELGITPDEVNAYYQMHPQAALRGDAAFFDNASQTYKLPEDWYQTVIKIEMGEDKTPRIISLTGKEAGFGLLNSYWKPDYPTDYLGPGYREYLFRKIKDAKQ